MNTVLLVIWTALGNQGQMSLTPTTLEKCIPVQHFLTEYGSDETLAACGSVRQVAVALAANGCTYMGTQDKGKTVDYWCRKGPPL